MTSTIAITGRSMRPYTIIDAAPIGTSSCNAELIATDQFYGSVDEF